MNAKVSIIIPCYRQARFLPYALTSALAQSYANIEVVVVNDGSDDDTQAVADQFKGKIQYVYKPNGGLASARNTGLKAASGKYVLFLDADDLLHPDAIAWLVEAVGDAEDGMSVMGWTDFTTVPGDRPDANKYPSAGTDLAEQLLIGDIPAVHAFLASRHAVCACGGFDPTLPSCEDWDLWIRLVVHGGLPVASVGRVGAYYRRYAGSMSTNGLLMDTAAYAIILRCLRKLQAPSRPDWLSGPVYGKTIRALRGDVATVAFGAAKELRQGGRYWESALWLWRSLRHGRMSRRAAMGLLKLAPHWALRRAAPRQSKDLADMSDNSKGAI